VTLAPTVVVRAHAKINLSLRVTGARPDGFHDLRTVFQSLALHDTLRFTVRPGPFDLQCDTEGVPLDGRNLVWRAATALWRFLGRKGDPCDVSISIEKQIPLQGGLGGGSSDAAAAMTALSSLWRAQVSPSDLAAIGSELGADVPYFLVGGTALGLGRGDQLYPLIDGPPFWVVVVVPPFGVPTADAYRWYDEQAGGCIARGVRLDGVWPPLEVVNDLEAVVVRRYPAIGSMKELLEESGAAAAAMSGSGSSVFGLFSSRAAALSAQKKLRGNGSRALLTRTLARREFTRLSTPVAAVTGCN
jgi:4-diphosphocytidyl-2-C-methyl-D-erythritol kinase